MLIPVSLWSILSVEGTGSGNLDKEDFFKDPLIFTWKCSVLPRYLSVKGWFMPIFIL